MPARPAEPRPALLRLSLSTPLGRFSLVCDEADLVYAAEWDDGWLRCATLLARFHGTRDPRGSNVSSAAREALARYFAGDTAAIDGIAIARAGSAFQARVWAALRAIPRGTVLSYGELARRLGHPRAARAVGHANGANPCAVIVPCHRLVGGNGALTGYAGGLERKRWLIAHEATAPARPAP